MPRSLYFLFTFFTVYSLLYIHELPIGLGSPSFARYEFGDKPHDWKLISSTNETLCNTILRDIKFPDLQGISYVSNGTTLNTTFWLSGQFEETNLTENFRQPTYVMGMILTHTNPPKVTYMTMVNHDLFTNWTKKTVEFLNESEDTRVLEKIGNYSGFFDKGDFEGGNNRGHVTLSLDLTRIGSPENFILYFYLDDFYRDGLDGCLVRDYGDHAAFIPPPEFAISGQTALRRGEEKTINLNINSDFNTPAKIDLKINNQTGITLKPLGDGPYLTTGDVTVLPLKTKVWNNASLGTHPIPIYANISLRAFELSDGSNTEVASMASLDTFYSPSIILNSTSLTIDVLDALNIEEKFENFWKIYGGIIAFIGAGFAAGLAGLVFDRLNKKRASSQI
jgi:hypothetical protein